MTWVLSATVFLSTAACDSKDAVEAKAAPMANSEKPAAVRSTKSVAVEADPAAEVVPPDRPLGSAKRGDPDFIEHEPEGPLTSDEQALIDADIKSLTKDQRRARAYARRKKIMQTPDSPQAQALLRGAQALLEGANYTPKSAPPAGAASDVKDGIVIPLPQGSTEASDKPSNKAP